MFKSQTRRLFLLTAIFAASLLSACTSTREIPTACPEPVACPESTPTTAKAAPMRLASWADLPGWANDDLLAAWPAFLQSCQALANRPQWPLWKAACEEANTLTNKDNATLHRFFEMHFAPYLLQNPDNTTQGLVTGYYEPLLQGSRVRTASYAQPVLGVPSDLLNIDLADVLPELKNMRLRGRLQGQKIVPYYTRSEITSRTKEYADRVLLWVNDAVELFFLQVQGSGRVRLADGSTVRLAYADQNGHPYQSIGRVLIKRGDLKAEQASMQGIQTWARAHPDRLNELLNSNPSYVFFREMPPKASDSNPSVGPIGALGVSLTSGRSIAVDPRHVPLGAPVFLSSTQPNSKNLLRRLVLAQDTGGAIRGVVRADFFWGFGDEAGKLAGRMKQPGQMWVLLPPGVAPR